MRPGGREDKLVEICPSAPRRRAITATPPTTKPGLPKRAGLWRRRLRRAALAGLLLFAGLVGWLFWPVELPPEPLLGRLPTDLVWGVEIREGARFWRQGGNQATELLASPLAEALLGQKPAIEARGRAQQIASQIDAFLARPAGLGLAGQALAGGLACGGQTAKNSDFVLVAKPGNYIRLLGRLALWLKGRAGRNGQYQLLAGELPLNPAHPQPFRLTLRDGYILAAGSEQRLDELLAGWGRPPRTAWPDLPATPSLTVLLKPDPAARRQLAEQLGHEFWLVRELLAVCRPPQIAAGEVQAGLDLNLRLTGRESPTGAKANSADRPPAQIAVPEPPADSYIYAAGWAAPEFSWAALCHRLWPEADRPLRGVNQPLSVFLHEWLDRGVIRPAAGAFALGVGPARPEADRPLVPPLPEIWTTWSIRPAALADAQREFAAGLARLVEYYAAPGGDTYYQEVRRVTRLIPAANPADYGRLELQPLFHAYAAPAWRLDESGGVFSTCRQALLARPAAKPREIKLPAADALAQIDFRFAPPPAAVAEWRAVILDKVERHGFLPPEDRQPLLQILDGLSGWAQSGLELSGRATLRPLPSGPADVEPDLRLEAGLTLRFAR